MKRTGSQAIWEALVGEGVETVFGYPGGAIMPAYDALPGYAIRHVLVRHEQGAAHMADGYARASGKVGVAVATSGPGATNLVTGIATAMMDSSPMVCITGQVGSTFLGSDAFQEIDITGITLPITKDAQQGKARLEEGPAPRQRKPHHAPELALRRAVALIDAAERPLILAGQGVLKAEASGILLQFAEKAGIPVTATLLGLGGFPASHPLALGMMGMHGEAWVNNALQEADLLIALGMRFDDRVTGKLSTFAVNAKKIHAEIDPSEINKNVRADVALQGDLRRTLEQLIPAVRQRERPAWLERIAALKADCTRRDVQAIPEDGRLLAPHVLHDLWRLTEGK